MDRVEAHRYFLLAIARGDPRGSNLLELTMERLDKNQLAKAISEAQDWLNSHHFDQKQTNQPKPVLGTTTAAPRNQTGARMPGAAQPSAEALISAKEDPAQTDESGRSVWTGVDRVVAIGDIHGDYSQLLAALRSAKLIDENCNWTGGKTHLVQTGNILGRGGDSRQALDLLMKLRQQAAAAGGYVHVLLGNREIMNLYGDLRYVSEADFAAFATPDSAKLRDREYDNFVRAAGPNFTITREEWNRQHPLGYFEQRAAFGPDGVYGKWLRSLNTVIRIDDTLFSHAGLSPKYAQMPIDEINRRVRAELNHLEQTRGALATDPEGPLFYRALATGNENQLLPVLEHTLDASGAKREVIGDTNPNAVITTRFGGRLVMIDVGADGGSYDQVGCLEITGGVPYGFHRGRRLTLPRDDNGADMLRYLQEAAALDPAPSPLAARIDELKNSIRSEAQ
jgi:hypothetical protein